MVSGGGWHAPGGACAGVEAALRAVSVVRGAGGDRAMSRAGPGGTRGGAPAGAGGLDHLSGAAPQRRDARRWPGLSGDGRAVARRTGRPPAEASETGGQRGTADICAGPAGRRGRHLGRGCRLRAGRALEGPPARAWKNRQWARAWSPEQIAQRLRLDFPGDETMRISHEAIYQALYVQGRGALRRELTACLRTGRALRVPRARSRGRGKSHVAPEIMISQRPAEAADRAVPGHWEGDLIIGLGSSAIGTLVERATRFTILLHLPRMPGRDDKVRKKNGPALAGHGAEAVREAVTRTITTLPEQLRRSLTWDQGAEMSQHAQLLIDTGVQVYFCDPHSPWQRGTNENTNGLLRQYFPKGTDLSVHSADALAAVAATLNARPRKTLVWRSPAEALDELLRSAQASVATTT